MGKELHMLRIAGRVAATPAKEGAFAANPGELIAHLNHFLGAKYAVEASYRSFADRVKGPWRDSLVDHWHEHAEDERKSAYDLAMKVVAMGADPIMTTIQVPPCTANVAGFMQCLMNQELDAIEAGRKLATMAGENMGLRVLAENTVVIDSHHIDDLRRMMAKLEG
jgi:bacterioferritin (cytochrome b1)